MTVYQATRAIDINATHYAYGATVPTVTVDAYRLDELGVVQAVPPALVVTLPGESYASSADVVAEAAARTAADAAAATANAGTYVPKDGAPADINTPAIKVNAVLGQVRNPFEYYDDQGVLRFSLSASGTAVGAGFAFTAKTASSVPAIVNAFAGQTTDLQRWRDSALATLATVSKDGRGIFVNQKEAGDNVRDRGADNTGATSAHVAIQAAITACTALGGGTVFVPPGTYLLTTRLALKTKVNIVGAGRGVTIFKAATGVTTAVMLGSSGDAVSDAIYEGFTIDGDYAISALTPVAGIQITNGARNTFRRLEIKNTSRQGITLTTHDDPTVETCTITGTGLDGNSAAHGVMLTTCLRGKIRGNRITGGQGMGIALLTSSTDCEITGNYISTIASTTMLECIGIASTNDRATISNNQIIDSQDNGISLSANDCTVTGNTINGAINNGIAVGGSHNTISGNVVKNAGREAPAVVYAGISLSGSTSASFNVISGNTIYDDQGTKTQDYGIRESTAAANYNLITGNVVRAVDQITGAVVVAGANSIAANNIV